MVKVGDIVQTFKCPYLAHHSFVIVTDVTESEIFYKYCKDYDDLCVKSHTKFKELTIKELIKIVC